MASRSHRYSSDSRRRSSHTELPLSVTEASLQHLSLTSKSPSPTHPTSTESDPSSSLINPQYTSNAYLGLPPESELEHDLGNHPHIDIDQRHWNPYDSQPSLDSQLQTLQFGLDPSTQQSQLEYGERTSQPETYSSATMSSLDYVTMLPSGPFVQQGFYHPNQYPSIPGYGDMDPLASQTLSSTLAATIHGATVTTSSSSYPTLNSTVDREIERQRRRHSPGGEWPSRRASHRERSASASSYRSSSRRSSNAVYQNVPGMAAQQQLPPPSSESPAFTSVFLTVSSSPPAQGYYSTLPQGARYDGRHDPPSFEYPPLPSQPLYNIDRSLPPSAASELALQGGYGGPPSIGSSTGVDEGVRVVGSRPKPQCWDHGCNGRQFSTFSNLLRHQREKSGTATKSECPYCGTVFTRTTARNGHMAQGKCKGQPRKGSTEE